jgi:hypothetical protein
MDMPFDLPLAPTERQAGLHRCFVGEQPKPAFAPKPLVSAWRIIVHNLSCLGVPTVTRRAYGSAFPLPAPPGLQST